MRQDCGTTEQIVQLVRSYICTYAHQSGEFAHRMPLSQKRTFHVLRLVATQKRLAVTMAECRALCAVFSCSIFCETLYIFGALSGSLHFTTHLWVTSKTWLDRMGIKSIKCPQIALQLASMCRMSVALIMSVYLPHIRLFMRLATKRNFSLSFKWRMRRWNQHKIITNFWHSCCAIVVSAISWLSSETAPAQIVHSQDLLDQYVLIATHTVMNCLSKSSRATISHFLTKCKRWRKNWAVLLRRHSCVG